MSPRLTPDGRELLRDFAGARYTSAATCGFVPRGPLALIEGMQRAALSYLEADANTEAYEAAAAAAGAADIIAEPEHPGAPARRGVL